MTAREIAELLARQVEAVARMLLPNGRRNGSEWTVGSIDGEEGKSLCVKLTGGKAGLWTDFADSSKGGDLLDLWSQVKNISLGDAIREAKSYLGIVDEPLRSKKTFSKPDKPKCHAPKSQVLEWLKTTRKLSEETIKAYRVAENGESVVFPSMRDGELIRWKSRNINDKHKCMTSSDSEPCLFGWQAIPAQDRTVFICEGEIDAMSWFELGYPALSVPSGAQSLTWIESEFNHLERFDLVYLSMDMDEAGQKSIPEIIERLGRERVRVIDLGAVKDANDLLTSGFDRFQVDAIVSRAKTVDPKELRRAKDFADEVVKEMLNPDDAGFFTPWDKVGSRLKFRPGEVIVLAGINKHGKSQGIGNISLDGIAQGEKFCIASMEFKPVKWIARLTRQAACIAQPAEGYIRAVHDWYGNNLFVFDVTGTAKTQKMLSVFRYAYKRYGVKRFVIDNLQKCGVPLDDNDKVKDFIDELTDFAKEFDATVFLVHHMRKGADESNTGKMGIKGSGAITDMVDTILIWWRNKEKENKKIQAQYDGAEFDESEEPDAVLYCEGQRNGEDEPKIRLWFDKKSNQFIENYNAKPKRYVQYSVVTNEARYG